MKKISLMIALVSTSLSSTYASDCELIKQDKQRLQCYDADSKKQTKTDVPVATKETIAQNENEFNAASMKFLNLSQTYLSIAALGWQNYLRNPGDNPGTIEEVSTRKSEIASLFADLMKMQGKQIKIEEKLKDYYAAWGLAYTAIRPNPTDRGRYYEQRINLEWRAWSQCQTD